MEETAQEMIQLSKEAKVKLDKASEKVVARALYLFTAFGKQRPEAMLRRMQTELKEMDISEYHKMGQEAATARTEHAEVAAAYLLLIAAGCTASDFE